MARLESWYKQDLKKPVPVRRMETVFNQDALGHLFGVEVYDNGQPVTLAGSVNGYCLLADGSTVPVLGTRTGNKAYIVLPQTAYSVIGPITITVKLTEGSAITTILAVVGMVSRSRTGQQVDPGSTVQDWTNQIAQAMQDVEDASAAQDAKIGDLNRALNKSILNDLSYYVGFYDTSNAYYKASDVGAIKKDTIYIYKVTVGTSGTYTLLAGTGTSNAQMIDTVGTADFVAGESIDFIYIPTGDYRFVRLSSAIDYSVEVYTPSQVENSDKTQNMLKIIKKYSVPFCEAASTGSSNVYQKFSELTIGKSYIFEITVAEDSIGAFGVGTATTAANIQTIATINTKANTPFLLPVYIAEKSGIKYSSFASANSIAYSLNIYELNDTVKMFSDHSVFVENGNALESSNYYKRLSPLKKREAYIMRVTVETAGNYFVQFGTSSVSSAMVDTLPNATFEANEPLDFIYFPTDACTYAKLSQDTAWSIKVYKVNGDYLQDYYVDYLANKIAQINAIDDESGLNGDSFIFITDYHRQANIRNSARMIEHIINNTGIGMVVFGGDTQDYERSFREAMHETEKFFDDMRCVKDNLFVVRGNHEYNYHYHRDDPETYDESIMLSYSQIYSVENKYNERKYSSISPLGDVAVDNPIQRIRYYMIGCDKTVEIENATRKWLFDDFKNLPDGYNVVIFSHKSFDVSGSSLVIGPRMQSIVNAMVALNNKSSFTYAPDGISTTYNYADVNAHAWCIIGGHTHYDADSTESVVSGYSSGILITATTCDAYLRQNSGGFQHNVLTRTPGTVTEQAFDVCKIDFTNKKLYMKRIGAGNDRTFDLI